MSILSQLGEVIPTDITAAVYVDEVAHVKQLLHGKSRQELLSLPMMSETRKLVSAFEPCKSFAHGMHRSHDSHMHSVLSDFRRRQCNS